eukprot:3675682-Karenia_brevis.AAC.1
MSKNNVHGESSAEKRSTIQDLGLNAISSNDGDVDMLKNIAHGDGNSGPESGKSCSKHSPANKMIDEN